MERVLAGWFAEGTSYLGTMWNNAGKGEAAEKFEDASEASAAGAAQASSSSSSPRNPRARSNDSAVSTESASSRASNVSAASNRSGSTRFNKVVNWMVFGSKKVLAKAGAGTSVSSPANNNQAATKKSALDILMATKGGNAFRDPADPAALQAVSVIGRGGYGKVMLMRNKATGRLIAVKEVAKSNLIDKPGSTRGVRPVSTKVEHAEMENLVLHTVGEHPFVTSFHGSFQNKDKIFMFLEYAPGGELFQHMQRQGVFSEARTRMYVAEITSALAFLHENGIVYRDLKPENVLLDSKGHLRLTDFGLSIQFNKCGDDNLMRCYSICGTPEYISPELILCATTKKNDRNATYGKTVDWWALGILMYEMLYRVPPFYSRERKAMLNKILACELQFPKTPAKLKPISQDAMDFIAALLKYDERDRLGYGNDGSFNVMAHAFFDGLDWDKLSSHEYEPEFVPALANNTDTSNFDGTFTKELLRVDPCSSCAFNLELTGFGFLPEDFSEDCWFERSTPDAKSLRI